MAFPYSFESENNASAFKAIHGAWQVPYLHGTEVALLEAIRDASSHSYPGGRFGNTLSVVQSSGTGKARTAHELSKLVFTLPLNARTRTGPSYPPPDVIGSYMAIRDSSREEYIAERYSSMLGLFFRCIRRWLQAQEPPLTSYYEMVHAWNTFLDRHRAEAYRAVVGVLQGTKPEPGLANVAEELADLLSVLQLEDTSRRSAEYASVPGVFSEQLDAQTRREVAELALESETRVAHLTNHHRVVIVVSVNAAHYLAERSTGSGSRKTYHEVFLQVLDACRPQPIFGICLSLSTSIALSPRSTALRVEPWMYEGMCLHMPFTVMPFDCHPSLATMLDTELTLESTSSIPFLAKFGRPLFWTMLEADAKQGVILLAIDKLTGFAALHRRWTECSEAGRMAVLDVRLCLDYDSHSAAARTLQETLISTHMRLLFSVPVHEQFESGYSSEPLLALAAVILWREWWRDRSWWHPAKELLSHFRCRALERSQRTKLVARVLLTQAYDDGALHQLSTNSTAGCTVQLFIEALFPPAIAARIAQSRPDNLAVDTEYDFKSAFDKAHLRFTHWTRLGDASGLTAAGLRTAFVRSMAFIGRSEQIGVDLVIPVLLDRTQPITPQNMSAILVQVRDRGGVRQDSSAEELGLFADEDTACSRPYCTLLMELGASKPRGDGEPEPAPLRVVQVEPHASRGVSRGPHPRFNIRAYGCSSSIYKVIQPEGQRYYDDILALSTFSLDRSFLWTTKHVWNMKPLWVAGHGTNSYTWAPEKQPEQEVLEVVEVVESRVDSGDHSISVSV